MVIASAILTIKAIVFKLLDLAFIGIIFLLFNPKAYVALNIIVLTILIMIYAKSYSWDI